MEPREEAAPNSTAKTKNLPDMPLVATVEGEKDEESIRLGGKPPLKTLFSLLVGPLLSQFTNSVYGLVVSLWVSKSHGNFGLQVLASIFLFDYITFSFGEFLLVSVSTKMSYLFGRRLAKDASQVVVDLFRLCFVLGAFLPAALLPCVKVIVRWLTDNDEDIANEAFKYMLPLLCASASELNYLLGIGVLQGEGRTLISGSIQITSLLMNMFVFNPLFLFKFKLGVWSAALSTVISEGIPGIILTTLIFSGKFTLKFNCKMFTSKPSKHSYSALKIGFASFIMNLSSAIPEFAMQKFVTMTAQKLGQLSPILALWDTFNKLYELGLAIMYALDGSFLPSASFAYGRRMFRRFQRLACHTLWLNVVWCVTFSALLIIFPTQIASIWSKETQFLYWAKELFPIGYCTLFLWPVSSISISYLESSNYPGRASMLSIFTTFIPLPLCSTLIFFFGKTDLRLMFMSYIGDDVLKTIISLIICIPAFITIKNAKDGFDIPGHPDEKTEEDEAPILSSYTNE